MRREDLPRILEIYAYARGQMKQNGNPNQWKDDRPTADQVEKDCDNKTGYVLEEEGKIIGVFAFLLGEDPTYCKIDGAWLNDEPYGTVHRVASGGQRSGILKEILSFCEKRAGNIRIDTHADNQIMRHLLEKYGYSPCGIIRIADGSPRIAYQKKI